MKSREQSLFAGLLQKQNRTQLAIILGVAAMLLICLLYTSDAADD